MIMKKIILFIFTSALWINGYSYWMLKCLIVETFDCLHYN